ncbi:hypothetical protein [uncultured Polaribacter sp.]|uniref:hypothetical protein n=1 Tax=uncultured Polaribacter sp. TaxID=174711 RepID=UPI002622A5FA|nr:hypothetical protein [uncultured Polaribacter sp.]
MKKTTFFIFTFITISLLSQTKLTSSLTETNTGTVWINSYKSEFTYDSNNNLTEDTELYWNATTSDQVQNLWDFKIKQKLWLI